MDWGGKVAAYFGGASVASGTLALLSQGALQPMRGWKEVLFEALVIIAAVSFAVFLLTGVAAFWPVLNKPFRRIHGTAQTASPETSGPVVTVTVNDVGRGAKLDRPQPHPPDLADLAPGQVVMLRAAITTFGSFLMVGNVDGRFGHTRSNTAPLLYLPELDQRLGQLTEITVATWPDVRWASELAEAVRRVEGDVRRLRQRAYGSGRNRGNGSSADRLDPSELRRSVRELRDLITNRYPGLAGSVTGKKNPSVSENLS